MQVWHDHGFLLLNIATTVARSVQFDVFRAWRFRAP